MIDRLAANSWHAAEDAKDLIERQVPPSRRKAVAVGYVNMAELLPADSKDRRKEASSMFMWNKSGTSFMQSRPVRLTISDPSVQLLTKLTS